MIDSPSKGSRRCQYEDANLLTSAQSQEKPHLARLRSRRETVSSWHKSLQSAQSSSLPRWLSGWLSGIYQHSIRGSQAPSVLTRKSRALKPALALCCQEMGKSDWTQLQEDGPVPGSCWWPAGDSRRWAAWRRHPGLSSSSARVWVC